MLSRLGRRWVLSFSSQEKLVTEDATGLITEYVAAVSDAVARLQEGLGADRVRRGPVDGGFPRSGVLRDGFEYHFHGAGCSVWRGDLKMHIEWASDGRYDIFDSWRLWEFAEQQPERFSSRSFKSVEEAVQKLRAAKVLTELREGNRAMLCLANAVPRRL